jgi:hypothetical protein
MHADNQARRLLAAELHLGLGGDPLKGYIVNFQSHVLENDVRLLLQVLLDRLLHRRFRMNPSVASSRTCQRQNYKTRHYRAHLNLPGFESTLPHAALDCQKKRRIRPLRG